MEQKIWKSVEVSKEKALVIRAYAIAKKIEINSVECGDGILIQVFVNENECFIFNSFLDLLNDCCEDCYYKGKREILNGINSIMNSVNL